MDYNLFDGLRFEPVSDMNMQNTGQTGKFPKHTPIGMAYVPFQQWEEPYEISVGFNTGTIFPELDLPLNTKGGIINERKR